MVYNDLACDEHELCYNREYRIENPQESLRSTSKYDIRTKRRSLKPKRVPLEREEEDWDRLVAEASRLQ